MAIAPHSTPPLQPEPPSAAPAPGGQVTDSELDTLRVLLGKIGSAKWHKRHAGSYSQGAGQYQITEHLVMSDNSDVAICSDCCDVDGEPSAIVADFIATSRNALPALLSEILASRKRLAACEAALTLIALLDEFDRRRKSGDQFVLWWVKSGYIFQGTTDPASGNDWEIETVGGNIEEALSAYVRNSAAEAKQVSP